MSPRPAVLATDGGPDACEPVTSWGRWLARGTSARLISVSHDAPRRMVLDLAIKREVQHVVTSLRCRDDEERPGRVDDSDLALLLRRAPCPALTIQPWAERRAGSYGVAVVGVDCSSEAREVARASARMLSIWGSPGRLILVHGCKMHPAELAATTPWPELLDRMRPERHEWLVALASELRSPKLVVEAVVRLAWAPDLIGGIAQRENADFASLGVAVRTEEREASLSRIHNHVFRKMPCPLLTSTATGPPADS